MRHVHIDANCINLSDSWNYRCIIGSRGSEWKQSWQRLLRFCRFEIISPLIKRTYCFYVFLPTPSVVDSLRNNVLLVINWQEQLLSVLSNRWETRLKDNYFRGRSGGRRGDGLYPPSLLWAGTSDYPYTQRGYDSCPTRNSRLSPIQSSDANWGTVSIR